MSNAWQFKPGNPEYERYIHSSHWRHIADNGVCGICGLPVSYDKSPSDIWAATIDHIVPLSRGGKHELSNCQLAHRLCNSTKQDDIEDYHIDWAEKNKLDNGRWTDALTKYSLHTRMQAAL